MKNFHKRVRENVTLSGQKTFTFEIDIDEAKHSQRGEGKKVRVCGAINCEKPQCPRRVKDA